jgi:hypothetical protein
MIVCPHCACAERFHRWGHQQAFDREKLHSVLSQHFMVMVLKEQAFIPWKILNWKGKVIGGVKYLLSRMGVHGSEENLAFETRKPCV